jgi:tetratricopeptide (TPR) repeat protein
LKKINNDLSGALADLNYALSRDASLSSALILRAKVKIKLNDFNSAIIDCDSAIANNYKLATSRIIKAIALYKSNKYNETIVETSNIIKSNPEDGLSYYLRGIVYKKNGNNLLFYKDIQKAQSLGFVNSKDELLIDMDVK